MASGLPRAGRHADPADLVQALAANAAAAATFDRLDAANRYSIVYRLNAVKRPTTRDRKLAEYVDMLARAANPSIPASPASPGNKACIPSAAGLLESPWGGGDRCVR